MKVGDIFRVSVGGDIYLCRVTYTRHEDVHAEHYSKKGYHPFSYWDLAVFPLLLFQPKTEQDWMLARMKGYYVE